jgi:retron-type reverse transcriptase
VERLYRQLFNPQLFLMAYGKLYSNRGAMTPGVTGETVDGMSLAKIGAIIGALRAERYRWQPVKRVYIPKKNSGKKRPLGLPTWSDKLVAEVVRLLLEAYYEPQFSDRSHGFRPGRGCHTALSEVVDIWKGTHWFIEGDISDCFGSLDHEVMLATLAEKIHDGRFLQLVSRMLKAGYLEDWTWHATLSGSPQGGIASPVRPTRTTRPWSTRSRGRRGTGTGRNCTGSACAAASFPARIPPTRATGGCDMSAMPTTGCWGSQAPGTKQRKSRRR